MIVVAICSHSPWIAGAERMLMHLAMGLKQSERFKPVVLIPGAERGPLMSVLTKAGVECRAIPIFDWFIYKKAEYFRDYFRGVHDVTPKIADALQQVRAEIVVVNTLTSLDPMLAAKSLGLPAVLWAHGVLGSGLLDNYQALHRFCEDLVLGAAHKVVTCSNWTRQHFAKDLPGDKVEAIYNWTDVPPYRQRARPRMKFASLSSLESHKGVDTAIGAIAEIRGAGLRAALDIYGDGYLREELKSMTRELRVDDRVRFFGRVTDIDKVYDQSTAILMPSFVEPFGMVAIEAMARSAPVISSRAGGQAEIFDAETGIFFEPGDASGLAERMRWVADHPEEATALAERAHARVSALFDGAKSKARFEALLLETLEGFTGYPDEAFAIEDVISVFLRDVDRTGGFHAVAGHVEITLAPREQAKARAVHAAPDPQQEINGADLRHSVLDSAFSSWLTDLERRDNVLSPVFLTRSLAAGDILVYPLELPTSEAVHVDILVDIAMHRDYPEQCFTCELLDAEDSSLLLRTGAWALADTPRGFVRMRWAARYEVGRHFKLRMTAHQAAADYQIRVYERNGSDTHPVDAKGPILKVLPAP